MQMVRREEMFFDNICRKSKQMYRWETELPEHSKKTACPRCNLKERIQIKKIFHTSQPKDSVLLPNS